MENLSKQKQIRPLFKYIGGKTWLRELLRQKIEFTTSKRNFNTYCEPFAGGLGSFLAVYDILLDKGIKKVLLSDINETLIYTYNAIKDEPLELIEEFISIEKGFVSLINEDLYKTKDKEKIKKLLVNAKDYFNKIKSEFNLNKNTVSLKQSARLIFLQKHSFNGVYRENSKGEYNTPFNWSGANMLSSIKEKVLELNSIFNSFDITFNVSSFADIKYDLDTLYYLDPPYLNEDISENKYHKALFDLNKQKLLIDKIKNSSFIYSNHKTKELMSYFEDFNSILVEEVKRKNIMSSSVSSRKEEKIEVVITKV